MPQLPTISAPAVQRAAYGGVQANLESALAPLKGSQAIASAIGQAGQLLGEFAHRSASLRNDAAMAEQQVEQEKAFGAFQNDLASTPNSSDWPALWEQHKKALQTTVTDIQKRMGPDARRQAQQEFTDWTTRNDIIVANKSKVAGIQEDTRRLTGYALDAWQTGNYELGMKQIDVLKAHGAVSDAQYEDWQKKGKEVSQYANAQKLRDADPVHAEEMVNTQNFPDLNQDQIRELKSFARTNLERVRNDTSRSYDEEIVNIQENNKDPGDIRDRMRADMEGGRMLASQYAVRIKRLDGTLGKDFDAAAGSLLWEQIEQVDPKDKVAVLELRNKLKVIDPYLRQDMDKALDDKLKPPNQQQEKPTAAIDALKGMLDANVFGPSKIPDDIFQAAGDQKTNKIEFWPNMWLYRLISGTKRGTHFVPALDESGNPIAAIDENGAPILTEEGARSVQRFEAARAKHKEYLDHMIRWYQQHPGASGNEQIQELRRVTAGDTDIMNGSKAVNWINGFAN